MTNKSVGGAQLYNGINNPIFSLCKLNVKIETFVHRFVDFLQFLRVTGIEVRANLADNPYCYFYCKIRRNAFL
jgi:hypothetical protein